MSLFMSELFSGKLNTIYSLIIDIVKCSQILNEANNLEVEL